MSNKIKMSIINTNGTIGMDISAQKIYPTLEDLEVTPSSIEQEFIHPNSYGYDKVTVKKVLSDDIEITPTIGSQQYIGLYGKIDVNAVDNTIDENIIPENIKEGINILGVTGNVKSIVLNPVEFTENGIYNAEQSTGFNRVTVNVPEATLQYLYNISYSDWTVESGQGLTPEQINAIHNIEVNIDNNGILTITYDQDVLDLNFSINGNDELIVTTIDGLTFRINANGELEAIY